MTFKEKTIKIIDSGVFTAFIIILCIFVVMWGFALMSVEYESQSTSAGLYCDGSERYHSVESEYPCCVACKDLGMEYFRWDYGGWFKEESCSCRVNNTVEQIW